MVWTNRTLIASRRNFLPLPVLVERCIDENRSESLSGLWMIGFIPYGQEMLKNNRDRANK